MQPFNVKDLIPHPKNEFYFDEMAGQKWQEFLESVRTSGVIEPPVVTDKRVIVSGHQRIRACKELGIESINCEVRIYENEDRVLKDLIETNIRQRGTIAGSELKMGRIIKELERIYGIKHGVRNDRKTPQLAESKSQDDIAKELGMSVDKLNRMKKLADLPDEYQEMLESGRISANTAASLVSKLTDEEQQVLLKALPATEKITQAVAQQYIDQIKGLTETNATLAQEAVEATRAVKASADSQEYMRIKERCEKAEEERRKYYEENQDLKKKAKPDAIKKAAEEAVTKTKEQYRKMIERLEKEVNELKKQETPEPETIEVFPDDYEELKEENARLKASQPHKNIRSVKIDETEEQRAIEYYNFLNTSAGTFLSDMEGFTIQKEFCIPIAPEKKAFLAENLRTIMNRCAEIIDFIKECNSKEAA